MNQFAVALEHSTSLDAPPESNQPSRDPSSLSLSSRPYLHGTLNVYADQVICFHHGLAYPLHDLSISLSVLAQLLLHLDGTLTVQELQGRFSEQQPDFVLNLLQRLDQFGLIELATDLTPSQSVQPLLIQLQKQIDNLDSSLQLKQILEDSSQDQSRILEGCILQYCHLVGSQQEFVYPLLETRGNHAVSSYLQQLYAQVSEQSQIVQTKLDSFTDALRNQVPLPYTNAIKNSLIYGSSTNLLQGLINLDLFQSFIVKSLQQYQATFSQLRPNPVREVLTQLERGVNSLKEIQLYLGSLPPLNAEQVQSLSGRSQVLIEMFEQFNPSAIAYYREHLVEERTMPLIFDGGLVQ